MLDESIREKLARANDWARVIQLLHKRIDACLNPVCNEFIERRDRDQIKQLIDLMPQGQQRDGMISFLDSLPAVGAKIGRENSE